MHANYPQPCASQRAPGGTPLHHERHLTEETALYRLAQHCAVGFIVLTEAVLR